MHMYVCIKAVVYGEYLFDFGLYSVEESMLGIFFLFVNRACLVTSVYAD